MTRCLCVLAVCAAPQLSDLADALEQADLVQGQVRAQLLLL